MIYEYIMEVSEKYQIDINFVNSKIVLYSETTQQWMKMINVFSIELQCNDEIVQKHK